ncbi:hypothetical protein H920_12639 [Fukomys damarensis]|uniref:Uncharacterized protein n=1 Tax=Fukomys damarensis TaxID=885580 RepID=A0A091D6Q1_FUKDA|nr:hypothetical protein H920_12639 [Fukomys damarensis]
MESTDTDDREVWEHAMHNAQRAEKHSEVQLPLDFFPITSARAQYLDPYAIKASEAWAASAPLVKDEDSSTPHKSPHLREVRHHKEATSSSPLWRPPPCSPPSYQSHDSSSSSSDTNETLSSSDDDPHFNDAFFQNMF